MTVARYSLPSFVTVGALYAWLYACAQHGAPTWHAQKRHQYCADFLHTLLWPAPLYLHRLKPETVCAFVDFPVLRWLWQRNDPLVNALLTPDVKTRDVDLLLDRNAPCLSYVRSTFHAPQSMHCASESMPSALSPPRSSHAAHRALSTKKYSASVMDIDIASHAQDDEMRAETLSCDSALKSAHSAREWASFTSPLSPPEPLRPWCASVIEASWCPPEVCLGCALHAPTARLVGWRIFGEKPFCVTSATLDPRWETYGLIQHISAYISPESVRHVVDVGTGTGCIGLSLLDIFAHGEMIGTDICPQALKCAAYNSQAHQQQHRSRWMHTSWLPQDTGEVDVVISNPPYVDKETIYTWEMPAHMCTCKMHLELGVLAEDVPQFFSKSFSHIASNARTKSHAQAHSLQSALSPEVAQWDPPGALYAAHRGLAAYEALVPQSYSRLRKGGVLALEIAWDQAHDVCALGAAAGFVDIVCLQDAHQRPRYVFGRKPQG